MLASYPKMYVSTSCMCITQIWGFLTSFVSIFSYLLYFSVHSLRRCVCFRSFLSSVDIFIVLNKAHTEQVFHRLNTRPNERYFQLYLFCSCRSRKITWNLIWFPLQFSLFLSAVASFAFYIAHTFTSIAFVMQFNH